MRMVALRRPKVGRLRRFTRRELNMILKYCRCDTSVALFTTIITENEVLFLCTTHYERAQAFSPARLEATWSAASTSPCTELYSSSTLGVPAEAWRSEPEALVPLVALSG